ncbi:HEPN domain-containing protein [Nostoc sp.]|uniref:HEPN domain-containing protein n=2 Tax=unclassified Nostoc TaxID=2593658 RepID=UPI002FF3448A
MKTDDINARIARIDYKLRTQKKSVAERIGLVQGELCPDINDLTDRFINNRFPALSNNELERFLPTLNVDNWYRENYGFKITPDYLNLKEIPFVMQGNIYYFIYPEKTENCNIIDCTNLPQIVKQDLTEVEIEYLQNSFKCGRRKLLAVEYLEDVVQYRDKKKSSENDFFAIPDKLKDNFYLSTETIDFIRFAIEDLNLAIVTLKNTRSYQFIIFPASQAIEKLLKACILSEKLILAKEVPELLNTLRKKKYGHKLFNIIGDEDFNKCFPSPEKIKSEIQNFPEAEKMFKDPTINPRYDPMEVSSEKAVKIIDATLNIFELVSEKFVTPLHRVMYYPELEEYYPQLKEYYDRLEDDDSFLDE